MVDLQGLCVRAKRKDRCQMKAFWMFAKPTKQCTVLLILDGHVTHTKNVVAIEKARDVGLIMVSLPPHTTHRLQPLDVAFFGPFKRYYNEALRMWMREQVGRPVTVWQVVEVMNVAYGKAATVQNAISGFKKTSGLWPLTMDIFQDCDFTAAASTDVTEGEQEHNHPPPAAAAVAAPPLTAVMKAVAE